MALKNGQYKSYKAPSSKLPSVFLCCWIHYCLGTLTVSLAVLAATNHLGKVFLSGQQLSLIYQNCLDTLLILFNTHWKVTGFCELLKISHLYVTRPVFIYLVKHCISVSELLSSGVFIISYVQLYFILPFLIPCIVIFCYLSHIKIFFLFFFNSFIHIFIN